MMRRVLNEFKVVTIFAPTDEAWTGVRRKLLQGGGASLTQLGVHLVLDYLDFAGLEAITPGVELTTWSECGNLQVVASSGESVMVL